MLYLFRYDDLKGSEIVRDMTVNNDDPKSFLELSESDMYYIVAEGFGGADSVNPPVVMISMTKQWVNSHCAALLFYQVV